MPKTWSSWVGSGANFNGNHIVIRSIAGLFQLQERLGRATHSSGKI